MKVYVLAGGQNSRGWPLTEFIPKCLWPLPDGKPIIRHIVENLIAQDTSITPGDIVICGLKRQENLFRYEFRDLHVSYHFLKENVGTLGHLYQVMKSQAMTNRFMVHYADMITDISYENMITAFNLSSQAATAMIAVAMVNNPYSEAQLKVLSPQSLRVSKFTEKNVLPHPIWMGIGIFEKDAWFMIDELANSVKDSDIGRDLLPQIANAGMLEAWAHAGEWLDIGTLASYKKLMDTAH